MIFHTAFSPPASNDTGIDCSRDEVRTKQEFKDECDINVIMARYMQSGVLPPGVGVAQYGDFSTVEDFQSSMELIKRAEEQFAAQPSKVRDRFNNNAAEFLEFVMDVANKEEAQKLGLLKDEKPAEPAVVAPVAPVAPVVPPTGEPKKAV